MIVLSLIFCLVTSPTTICQKISPQEYDSNLACMLDAQQKAAEWVEDHPNWTLKRWRCGPAEKEA